MQNLFFDRLNLIQDHLLITKQREFARSIGIEFSKYQTYRKGSSPSIDVLDVILSKQGWINAEWLITGNGDMIKSEMVYSEDDPWKLIREQNEEIRTLIKENSRLEFLLEANNIEFSKKGSSR
jgi:hypothetical protein